MRDCRDPLAGTDVCAHHRPAALLAAALTRGSNSSAAE
jgi:hypothetical protein